MGRALSLLLVGLLAAALFASKPTDPARATALSVPELLAQPVQVAGTEITLGAAILSGPAARRGEDGRLTIRLGGVRLACTAFPTADLTVHGLARAALIAGLRRQAALRGDALWIEGELLPVPGGASVLVWLDPKEFGLSCDSRIAAPFEARLPGWRPPSRTALLPPLIAILLALLLGRPVLALACGAWAAALLLRRRAEGAGGLAGDLAHSFVAAARELIWPLLADPARLVVLGSVIATLLMFAVMASNGSLGGLRDRLAGHVRDARGAQVATWALGCCVFFDERASALLSGPTLRPLAERMRVSREKLAYLVDTSATALAGLALCGAWIAFASLETGSQLPGAKLAPAEARSLLLEGLPLRFYSILALVLGTAVALSGRDFGPMLTAERRARRTGATLRAGARPLLGEAALPFEPATGAAPGAGRALLPLFVFLGVSMVGSLRASGDAIHSLLAGGVAGLLVAVAQAVAARSLARSLRGAAAALIALVPALALLVLAWSMASAGEALGAGTYLAARLGDHLVPQILPALLFLASAAVAFSTGSCWVTLGTLLPLAVGLSFHAGKETDLGGRLMLALSLAAVLDGAICGRHLSPLGDSTVLASTTTASDQLDHVRTQLPYALVSLLAALLLGFLPCVFAGQHPALALLLSSAVVLALLFGLGRKSDAPAPGPAPP